ncbi:Protein SHQ1-like protein [Hypsibius exemplaris]|uniref:Protein SHQ1 homolog n=1 Tax=Hypsibius exemplaris TaxID=2072580 RepID=A0A9X6RNH5_HYPEX|nr:Protein SHQ1-like protein [Hypsibius exemplaris]
MLTPRFTLSQDEQFVTVTIRVPFAKVSEAEVEVLDNELHFYSKPYHLRLYFTGDVVEEGLQTDYHCSEASFDIKVRKKVPGTRFTDLEMITKLLTPPGSWTLMGPAIEELDSGFDTPVSEDLQASKSETDCKFDWLLPQSMPEEEVGAGDATLGRHKYGFGLQQHGVFRGLTEELRLVLDVKDVDSLTPGQVRAAREELEAEAFEEEHYLADLFYNEEIDELLNFKPWWIEVANSPAPVNDKLYFTEDELDVLKELPRQHLHVPLDALPYTWSTLAELIFGYAYDYRTTMGSSTVESSWTVTKLSPTLSCLDSFVTIKDALRASFRRSLIYPLYRNFELSSQILKDVCKIFSLGRRALLKCLLTIRKLCAGTQENRYILNDLYITSYCVWIQTVQEAAVREICLEMAGLKFEKPEMDLDLVDTETAAQLALQEEEGSGSNTTTAKVDLEQVMAGLTIDSDDDEVE